MTTLHGFTGVSLVVKDDKGKYASLGDALDVIGLFALAQVLIHFMLVKWVMLALAALAWLVLTLLILSVSGGQWVIAFVAARIH